MGKQQVINQIGEILTKVNLPFKVKSMTMAQIINESAWLTKAPGFNCLGIKFLSTDEGKFKKQIFTTQEWNPVKQKFESHDLAFRAYDSFVDCIKDYCRFMGYSHYAQVQKADNFIEATTAVRVAGYATSPAYDKGLRKTILAYKLYKYDYRQNPDEWVTTNFQRKEGFSSAYIDGKRYYKIIEWPAVYEFNTIKVFTNLQVVRTHYGRPVTITNTGNLYRWVIYNGAIGGAAFSQHLYSNAGDIKIKGIKPYDIYIFAKDNTTFKGFGIGKPELITGGLIHLDCRAKFTVWYY